MRFRFYKSLDFKELIALLKINGSFDKATDSKRIFSKLIRQNPKSIILAVEGKQIAGYVFAVYTPFESYIHHLGVAPAFQSKGLGTMLLKFAEKTLKQEGAKRINLFCSKDKIEYYKNRGWVFLENAACFEKYP